MEAILTYILLLSLAAGAFFLMAYKGVFKASQYVAVMYAGFCVFGVISSINMLIIPSLGDFEYVMSIISIIFMFVLCSLLMLPLLKECGSFNLQDYRKNHSSGHSHLFIYLMVWSTIALIFMQYMAKNGLPPLFEFSLAGWDPYGARGDKWTDLSEGTILYRFGFYTLPSIMVAGSYIMYLVERTKKTKWIFVLNVLVALPLAVMMAQKGPIMELLLLIIITDILVNDSAKLYYKLLGLGFLGVILMGLLLWSYLPERSMFDMMIIIPKYLNHRLLELPALAHAQIMHLYPGQFSFLDGKAMPNPGHVFAFENESIPRILGRWVNGQKMQNFSLPTYSNMYANYSWIGLISSVPIIMIQAAALQFLFSRFEWNIFGIGLFLLTCKSLVGFSTGFSALILEPIHIYCFIFVGIIFLIETYINRLKKGIQI